MKHVFALILCVVLLVGCSKTPGNDSNIHYYTGVYPLKFWETEKMEDSQFVLVPDAEAAIRIANVIFESISKPRTEESFEIQSVFYDEEDEVWVLLFREPYPETGAISTGPCYAIAIQKQDGKVLGINYE